MQKPERKETEKQQLDKEGIERRLSGVKAELKEAVEAGKISAEEAEKKLNALRQKLIGSIQKPEKAKVGDKQVDKEGIERRLGEMKADLKAAVEAGKISAVDAETKLSEARRKLSEAARKGERED
jgi:hypothetical protein